jgi:hypothetical protein
MDFLSLEIMMRRAQQRHLVSFLQQPLMSEQRRIIEVDSQGRVQSVESPGAHETRERLRKLAWLFDSSISIPGTRFTVGLDALIGLIPVLGDLIGVALSSLIIAEANRLGAPKSVLWRMAGNVGIEGLVGMVPFAGDVLDAVFKANQRNVKLLDAWYQNPGKTERASRWFGVLLVATAVLFLGLSIYTGFAILRWVVGLF